MWSFPSTKIVACLLELETNTGVGFEIVDEFAISHDLVGVKCSNEL